LAWLDETKKEYSRIEAALGSVAGGFLGFSELED
jgi:hypothetical protein